MDQSFGICAFVFGPARNGQNPDSHRTTSCAALFHTTAGQAFKPWMDADIAIDLCLDISLALGTQ